MAKASAAGMLDNSSYASYTVVVPRAATPVFSPAPGVYSNLSVAVSISCATPGATVRYTLNGSEPTATSQVYTSAITLTQTATVRARASLAGMLDSAVASGAYTVVPPRVAAPTFAPPGGTYTGSVSVAISCATPGATIVYCLGANTSGGLMTYLPYTGPVALTTSAVLVAKASVPGMLDTSAYASYTVVIPRVVTPVLSPAPGVYSNLSVAVSISCATPGATVRYTLNGSEPTATSQVYTTAITLTQTATVRAKASAAGMLDSAAVYGAYTLVPQRVATPIFTPQGGAFASATTVTIACDTPDAVIRYTLDGSEATSSSEIYDAPITLSAPAAIHARAFKADMLDSYSAATSYYWSAPVATRASFTSGSASVPNN